MGLRLILAILFYTLGTNQLYCQEKSFQLDLNSYYVTTSTQIERAGRSQVSARNINLTPVLTYFQRIDSVGVYFSLGHGFEHSRSLGANDYNFPQNMLTEQLVNSRERYFWVFRTGVYQDFIYQKLYIKFPIGIHTEYTHRGKSILEGTQSQPNTGFTNYQKIELDFSNSLFIGFSATPQVSYAVLQNCNIGLHLNIIGGVQTNLRPHKNIRIQSTNNSNSAVNSEQVTHYSGKWYWNARVSPGINLVYLIQTK